MPLGTVTKYNGMEKQLQADANRQWDDATAGSNMFIIADNTYTPDATHSTTFDLTGVITAGDGAPINVTSPTIDDTTTPGTTYYDSGIADFGSTVTVTGKYLICIQPVVAGTFDVATSNLLWVVDLDTTNGTASKVAVGSDFALTPPVNGWIAST